MPWRQLRSISGDTALTTRFASAQDCFMISNSLRFALFFIASCALVSGAGAQNRPETTCLPAQAMKAAQLHGLWDVRFSEPPAGLPERATMLLERHAEFSES